MSLKTENSRRVAKSRPVCMGLALKEYLSLVCFTHRCSSTQMMIEQFIQFSSISHSEVDERTGDEC
jgi:hypothetical protein